jgi:hypothetical protein
VGAIWSTRDLFCWSPAIDKLGSAFTQTTQELLAGMDTPNETAPDGNETVTPILGTKDGNTAADHDEPYRFGRRPNARAPYPFTERQYARLLILRSRVQATEDLTDRAAA